MHIIAAKAVCFKEASSDDFKKYQEQIIKNAKALASALNDKEFKLVSGGTDNHLMLIDLRNKNLTGKEAETILDEVGITVNKNTIPYDPQSPFVTSGIRIGTPAITTRGMKEEDMERISEAIFLTLTDVNKNKLKIEQIVQELCEEYPLYKDLVID